MGVNSTFTITSETAFKVIKYKLCNASQQELECLLGCFESSEYRNYTIIETNNIEDIDRPEFHIFNVDDFETN